MDVLDRIVADLVETGYSVRKGLIAPDDVTRLAEDARARFLAGEFRPAGIGRGAEHAVNPEIRGDSLLWLDPASPRPAERPLFAAVEALSTHLNRELFLGLDHFELQLAVYPVGAGYERHLDQFHEVRERIVTYLLYLNAGWRPEDGGALRIHAAHGDRPWLDVLPEAGVLVVFLSDRIEHEVLPTQRERWSVGGWLRRRPRSGLPPT